MGTYTMPSTNNYVPTKVNSIKSCLELCTDQDNCHVAMYFEKVCYRIRSLQDAQNMKLPKSGWYMFTKKLFKEALYNTVSNKTQGVYTTNAGKATNVWNKHVGGQ